MKENTIWDLYINVKNPNAFKKQEAQSKKSLANIDKGIASTNKGLSSSAMKAGAVVGAVSLIGVALVKVGRASIDTAGKFEKFEAVLTNTLGTRGEAGEAMKMIEDFAAETPFAVDELTGSFVKLANQGFKPTKTEMKSLGDLASSVGKGYDQLAEALIDAQVGEMERLKEFGIRAQKEGDKVMFTFKGVKKEVDFTETSIQDYILSLGNLKGVSGSMNKISKTTIGLQSNLGDATTQLSKALGQRLEPATKKTYKGLISLVSGLKDIVAVDADEKLKKERQEVNLLAASLMMTSTPLEKRNEAYAELAEIHPDIVEGIDSENVSTEALRKNLAEYNKEMSIKIALAGLEEEEEKLLGKQYRKNANLQLEQAEAYQKMSAIRENAIEKGISEGGASILDEMIQSIDEGDTKKVFELREKLAKLSADGGDLIGKNVASSMEQTLGTMLYQIDNAKLAIERFDKKNLSDLDKLKGTIAFLEGKLSKTTGIDPNEPVTPETPDTASGTETQDLITKLSSSTNVRNITNNYNIGTGVNIGEIRTENITEAARETGDEFLKVLQESMVQSGQQN